MLGIKNGRQPQLDNAVGHRHHGLLYVKVPAPAAMRLLTYRSGDVSMITT